MNCLHRERRVTDRHRATTIRLKKRSKFELNTALMGPIGKSAPVLSRRRAPLRRDSRIPEGRRVQPRRSARCEMRGVMSNSVCGVAEHGADGPARRSSSARGRGGRDHRLFHSPRAVAGRDRMARLPRRSSSQGAACGSGPGPGANASSLRNEPAAGKAPLDCRACSRVGWTSLPLTSHSAHFAGNTRSGRWTRRGGSRWADRNLCLSSDSCLLE